MTFKTLAIGMTLACTTLSAGALLADATAQANGAAELSAAGQDVHVGAGADSGTELGIGQASATVHDATDRAERQLEQRRGQAASTVEGATDRAGQALDDAAGAAGRGSGGGGVSGSASGGVGVAGEAGRR
ncbi:hypothetical protein [Halomonas getboli]|uniref:hypothetical protein n=1 Tax=Halomonas getboli TaxID=2935862 RepID=UPI001FFF6472|nr:hypothetical protein [Halomonas getboli]MCK2183387.1 hypothetical protein [Halomonas getboli]